jgi:hypothetical protein
MRNSEIKDYFLHLFLNLIFDRIASKSGSENKSGRKKDQSRSEKSSSWIEFRLHLVTTKIIRTGIYCMLKINTNVTIQEIENIFR